MEVFQPIFKNDEEKNLVVILLVIGIFLGFIPFLIGYFGLKNELSENSMNMVKEYLNFELVLFLVSVIVSVIPIVGILGSLIVCPILLIIHIIVIVAGLLAVINNTTIKIPTIIKLIH